MRASACKLAEEEHINSPEGKITNTLYKAQQLNQLGKKNNTRSLSKDLLVKTPHSLALIYKEQRYRNHDQNIMK